MRNIVNLPEEIVLDILCRLPAKSLGRCKCVSKPWRTLISDPKFIQTHLSLINRLVDKLSLVLDKGSLFVVDFDGKPPPFGAHGSVSPTRLKFQENHDWYAARWSINGLVLAINSRFELFVLNPTTLECKQLPKPPRSENLVRPGYGKFGYEFGFGFKPRNEDLVRDGIFGFGYDSTSDDYKVVIISLPVIVHVYTFKSDTWVSQRFQNLPFRLDMAFSWNQKGVFLNSSLHWIGENREICPQYGKFSKRAATIIAFDLADEKFRVVPLPSQCEPFKDNMVPAVGVVGGSFCIICQEFPYQPQVPGRVDVWVMKEYGVEESWIKLSLYQDIRYAYIACFWGNDEFLLVNGKAKVTIYNVNEKSSRDIVIRGLQSVGGAPSVVGCPFVDSLLSPKQPPKQPDEVDK